MSPQDHVVFLDGHHLAMRELVAVARHDSRVGIAPDARDRVEVSRRAVQAALASGLPTYGINTGFGRLSEVAIPEDQLQQLQLNLILSHAAAVGPPLDRSVVRAAMALRVNALCRGESGIRLEVLELLCSCLNHGVIPVVPAQGSLGASGDLAPLAHIALVLIGRGEAQTADGRRLSGDAALATAGLRPVVLGAKEGLALINGTQVMTAIAVLAMHDAQQVVSAAHAAAALTMEALAGKRDAMDPRIHAARPHPGQIWVAVEMLRLLGGSTLTRGRGEGRVQDAYSLRCVPQVHGAAVDALRYVEDVLAREINSTTDNPLVFVSTRDSEDLDTGDAPACDVISGGNFHGQPVSIAMDLAAIALSTIANISERRTERLVNPDLSGLPAFLTRSGGLESGLMIAQYTAASLASENKILASPASVDSIPSSANQEDHVSMGTTAARKFARVVEQTRHVVAIELLAAAQALDLRAELEGIEHLAAMLGGGTGRLYGLIREAVPVMLTDRELAPDINALAGLIAAGAVQAAITDSS